MANRVKRADRPEGQGAVSSDSRRADRGEAPAPNSIWRSRQSSAAPRLPSTAGIAPMSGCRERAAAFAQRDRAPVTVAAEHSAFDFSIHR